MTIEKYISDLISILCNNRVRWIRAIGLTLSASKREFTDTKTETMATDGVTLYVNNTWCLSRSKLDNLFTLVHEGLHIWFQHSIRLRDTYPHMRDLVHMAADYAVNLTAVQQGCPWEMPADGLYDERFVDDKGQCLNVERIVHMLLQDTQNQDAPGDSNSDTAKQSAAKDDAEDNQSGESGESGETGQAGGNTKTPASCGELLEAPSATDIAELGRKLTAATQLSKGAGGGDMPAEMLNAVTAANQNSETDWLDRLRDRFASAVDQSDYSFERINAPYAAIGMIEPSMYREAIGKIAIIGDESSSMSDEALTVISEQTAAVIDEWNPEEVLIVRHTHCVEYTETLASGEMPTPRKKRAHGGTYFNPVYDLLESEGVEVAIWITDCMPCDRAINNRQIETIWLGTETDSEFYWNREIGFGEYIRVATC